MTLVLEYDTIVGMVDEPEIRYGFNISGFYRNPKKWYKLFNFQHGCCAICGKHQANLKCTLCVDHNHTTGKVRGLLCNSCNAILGMAHDDIQILQKAIEYLNR